MKKTSLLMIATSALLTSADSRAGNQWNKPVTVSLTSARADYDQRGRLVWTYQVSEGSWQLLKKRGIVAFVDAYTTYIKSGREVRVFRYRAHLKRSGQVWLGKQSLHGWLAAEFKIAGAMGESIITGMLIKGQFMAHSRWTLQRQAAGAPRRVKGATYAQIIQACNRAFGTIQRRQRCIEIAKTLPRATVLGTIHACRKSYPSTSQILDCINRAPRPHRSVRP